MATRDHVNARTIRGMGNTAVQTCTTREAGPSWVLAPTVVLAPEIERDEVELDRRPVFTHPTDAQRAASAHQLTLRGAALDAFLQFRWLDSDRSKLTAGGRRLTNDETRALTHRERVIVRRFAAATFERSLLSTLVFGPCVATPRVFRSVASALHVNNLDRFVRTEVLLAVVVFAAVLGAMLAVAASL